MSDTIQAIGGWINEMFFPGIGEKLVEAGYEGPEREEYEALLRAQAESAEGSVASHFFATGMHCDKCGEIVTQQNDSVSLIFLRFHGELPGGLDRISYGARHLLPVGDCPGDPYRAQYLEGQPRDTQGYPYDVEREVEYRAAYAVLIAL